MLLQAATDYLGTPSPLANMVTAAGVSAWTINRLRQWKAVPFINQNSDNINRAVSVVFALATTLGLHFAFHDDVSGAHHGGILEIGVPNTQEFLGALWRTLGSYIMQQGASRGFIKHEAGLQAADAVADTVKSRREELADVVERNDGSVLNLKGPNPMGTNEQIEFPWTQKKGGL